MFLQTMTYLEQQGANTNDDEQFVGKNAFEHIPFSVHLSRIDFVKDLHHHKCVEQDSQMLGWTGIMSTPKTVLNVEQDVTIETDNKHHDQLVEAMSDDESQH